MSTYHIFKAILGKRSHSLSFAHVYRLLSMYPIAHWCIYWSFTLVAYNIYFVFSYTLESFFSYFRSCLRRLVHFNNILFAYYSQAFEGDFWHRCSWIHAIHMWEWGIERIIFTWEEWKHLLPLSQWAVHNKNSSKSWG